MTKMFGELAMFSGRSNRPLAEAICKQLNIPLADAQIIDFPNENIFIQLKSTVARHVINEIKLKTNT